MLEETYLGLCYERGDGVKKDFEKAAKWYKSGAYNEDAIAMWHMGLCYESGIGVEKSFTIAVEWYEKAAEKGCPMAQTRLGKCYESGMGTIKDNEKAVSMYQKAANQGDLEAQQRLGVCYDLGVGVAQDKERALYWFSRAALETYRDEYNQGSSIAKKRIESYSDLGIHTLEYQEKKDWYELDSEAIGTVESEYETYNRSIIPSECEDFDDCYFETISEETDSSRINRKIAKERVKYIEKAVLGDKNAMCELAKEKGVFDSYANAWLEKSLNNDDENIEYYEGENLYHEYTGDEYYIRKYPVEKHLTEGVRLLWKSAEKGNKKAQRLFAIAYHEHMEDYYQRKIIEWLLPIAKSGDVEVQYILGNYIEKRSINNFSMIHEEAIKWYQKAALQGHTEAQYKLGLCYELGAITKGDLEKAFYWFYQAAKKHHIHALYKVGHFYEFGKVVELNPMKAVEYYGEHAGVGDSIKADYRLGYCYEHGVGVEKDIKKSMYWYAQSAYSGYFKACEAFIRCYENNSINKIEDEENGLYCDFDAVYTKTALKLGRYYEEGVCVDKSEKKAVELYTKALEKGNKDAEYQLAKCYELGIGLDKNEEKAIELYTKLSKKLLAYGDLYALYYLAQCYEYGKGVKKHTEKAREKYIELKNFIERTYSHSSEPVDSSDNPLVELDYYKYMTYEYNKYFNDGDPHFRLNYRDDQSDIKAFLIEVENAIERIEGNHGNTLNTDIENGCVMHEENTIER